VKLSGWKKVDSAGKTYLSIAVDRYVPEEKPVTSGFDDMDSEF
jgi:hypothetical protein